MLQAQWGYSQDAGSYSQVTRRSAAAPTAVPLRPLSLSLCAAPPPPPPPQLSPLASFLFLPFLHMNTRRFVSVSLPGPPPAPPDPWWPNPAGHNSWCPEPEATSGASRGESPDWSIRGLAGEGHKCTRTSCDPGTLSPFLQRCEQRWTSSCWVPTQILLVFSDAPCGNTAAVACCKLQRVKSSLA